MNASAFRGASRTPDEPLRAALADVMTVRRAVADTASAAVHRAAASERAATAADVDRRPGRAALSTDTLAAADQVVAAPSTWRVAWQTRTLLSQPRVARPSARRVDPAQDCVALRAAEPYAAPAVSAAAVLASSAFVARYEDAVSAERRDPASALSRPAVRAAAAEQVRPAAQAAVALRRPVRRQQPERLRRPELRQPALRQSSAAALVPRRPTQELRPSLPVAAAARPRPAA